MYEYTCTGKGANGDHCCYMAGAPCPYLVENTAGRRFACALIIKYGSIEAMVKSSEYKPIGDHWVSTGQVHEYCLTFDPAFCCRPEFRDGRRNETHVPFDDIDRYDGRFD